MVCDLLKTNQAISKNFFVLNDGDNFVHTTFPKY